MPSLPGVYTQAETLAELEANLREAIEVYLADESAAAAAAAEENGRVLEIVVPLIRMATCVNDHG